MKKFDQQKEILKYDGMALIEKNRFLQSNLSVLGVSDLPEKHQQPFLDYYAQIRILVQEGMKVLELGAGTGRHSFPVLEQKADLVALDISKESLALLDLKYAHKVRCVMGDIADLPFPKDSFDCVISAGSLSYGEPEQVLKEVIRVLKPGGSLIFLDSLNHNYVYRVNRFIHFLRGKRTLSTLKWMPRMNTLKEYQQYFEENKCTQYGSFLFLERPLELIVTKRIKIKIIQHLSSIFKNSGFKFLLTCKTLKN
jgi:ubiquinone/menaquinone biosynthesis C-methylase UbiE